MASRIAQIGDVIDDPFARQAPNTRLEETRDGRYRVISGDENPNASTNAMRAATAGVETAERKRRNVKRASVELRHSRRRLAHRARPRGHHGRARRTARRRTARATRAGPGDPDLPEPPGDAGSSADRAP